MRSGAEGGGTKAVVLVGSKTGARTDRGPQIPPEASWPPYCKGYTQIWLILYSNGRRTQLRRSSPKGERRKRSIAPGSLLLQVWFALVGQLLAAARIVKL